MKYPIGIQNFGEIRRDGYAYVDKTALMYKLVSEGKYYFLSRPRRFGKSLFLSTLEAYFEGQKELFEGLAVSHLEKEWVKHPILHLDLNAEKYDTAEALYNMLDDFLAKEEDKYGRAETERSFGLRFMGGNFGQYSGLTDHSTATKYFLKIKRNFRFVRAYPAEALCEPVFRTWHFFWRLLNG